jgi:hypothetical protein
MLSTSPSQPMEVTKKGEEFPFSSQITTSVKKSNPQEEEIKDHVSSSRISQNPKSSKKDVGIEFGSTMEMEAKISSLLKKGVDDDEDSDSDDDNNPPLPPHTSDLVGKGGKEDEDAPPLPPRKNAPIRRNTQKKSLPKSSAIVFSPKKLGSKANPKLTGKMKGVSQASSIKSPGNMKSDLQSSKSNIRNNTNVNDYKMNNPSLSLQTPSINSQSNEATSLVFPPLPSLPSLPPPSLPPTCLSPPSLPLLPSGHNSFLSMSTDLNGSFMRTADFESLPPLPLPPDMNKEGCIIMR